MAEKTGVPRVKTESWVSFCVWTKNHVLQPSCEGDIQLKPPFSSRAGCSNLNLPREPLHYLANPFFGCTTSLLKIQFRSIEFFNGQRSIPSLVFWLFVYFSWTSIGWTQNGKKALTTATTTTATMLSTLTTSTTCYRLKTYFYLLYFLSSFRRAWIPMSSNKKL